MRYGWFSRTTDCLLTKRIPDLESREVALERSVCPLCGAPRIGHGLRPTPIGGMHDLSGDPHVIVGETHAAPEV